MKNKSIIVVLFLIIVIFIGVFLLNRPKPKKQLKDNIIKKEEVKEEKKELTIDDYKNNNVNELGEVPIMMYHGIHNKKNSETEYTGGNVDRDGYQRTSEAFRADLEFYYQNNYRMIRLTDYVDGNIDVELGKSPIILTFDDGLENNIKVTGLDKDGNIIIDPNSAVGILEEFKTKYKDYNVTATFFVNDELFNQDEYNEKILKWLVDNGYDIGNHTNSHVNFSKCDTLKSEEEVGSIYSKLDSIIKDKYVNIVALPFGSPYSLDHENMSHIFTSTYNGKTYETKSALRVGWKAELSPFDLDFNPKFLKRIRAYDNNGVEFDIEMNFNLLESVRYISDGDKNKVVIPEYKKESLNNDIKKEIIKY
ncbi:MAG: polysaccharide deacetylase family protein [bacterium]|nr:polysaccharide deacetylase family protein [bacterium]